MIVKKLCLLLVASALTAGCASRKFSTTSRSAIEQLLLSGAVDRLLEKLDMPMLRGTKLFVDFANLEGTDVMYVKVALRARLAHQGATLVGAADKADYVMEVASGALATEHKSGLIGLPSIPVPQAGMPTPEVPFYKAVEQTAIVKLLIFVHKGGQFVAADQYYAKSDRDESFLLWYRFQRKDDVREGWERADMKLSDKAARAVAESKR